LFAQIEVAIALDRQGRRCLGNWQGRGAGGALMAGLSKTDLESRWKRKGTSRLVG
jgi:hypothetical protein